ncbi:hypothetical protein ABPG74_020698 [Tetrahymena malaccensis]
MKQLAINILNFQISTFGPYNKKYSNQTHYESLFVGLIGANHYRISKLLKFFSIQIDIESQFQIDIYKSEEFSLVLKVLHLINLNKEQADLYKQKLTQNYNLIYLQFRKEFYCHIQQKNYYYNKNLEQIQHFTFKKENKGYKEEFSEYLNKLIQQAKRENSTKKRSTKQIENDFFKDQYCLILQYQEGNQIAINIKQEQQLELFINSFIYKSSDLLIVIVNSFQSNVQLYLQKIYETVDQNASIITLHHIAYLKDQEEISEYESQLVKTNYLTKEKYKGITFFSQYYNSYDLLQTKKQIICHMLLPSEFSNEFSRYVEGIKIIINDFQLNRHQKKQANFQKFTEKLNQQFNQ